MRTKILAAFVAGGLLVGAAFVASAISSPGTASAQEDGDNPESQGGLFDHVTGFLEEVLDGLVDDGTLDQDQADAVVDAVEDRISEVWEKHRELADLVHGFLEDGVITTEEAEELPDDHPLLDERFDEAWEDGELTIEDLPGFAGFREGFGPGPGFGFERHRIPDIDPGDRPDFSRFEFGDLRDLLDDGGLDQSEYDELNEDHPLKQNDVSEYLEDGLITPDELAELGIRIWTGESDQDA